MTYPAQEPVGVRHIVSSEGVLSGPGVHPVHPPARDDRQADPAEEHHEGVEVEVSLALALSLIICPDNR